MAFTTANGSQMSDMNVTPLVDVMLVMLIIFMVTVPTISFSNAIDLTHTPPNSNVAPPEPLRLHIGAGDTLSLNGQPVSMAQLRARFAMEAAKGMVGGQLDPQRQSALQLAVEPEVDYGLVAQVLATAKNQNLQRIGFTD
jgi:biopolymer transport protein ExbD